MTTAAANTHDPRPAEPDSDAALKNAFVAWLATQPLSADRRHAYHYAIDRFFAWRRLHPGCGDPAWYYYSGLCGSAISEGQLEITREALALWNAYQRAEPSATGRGAGSRRGTSAVDRSRLERATIGVATTRVERETPIMTPANQRS